MNGANTVNQVILKALKANYYESKLVFMKNRVTPVCVPEHSYFEGNEVAEQLAK